MGEGEYMSFDFDIDMRLLGFDFFICGFTFGSHTCWMYREYRECIVCVAFRKARKGTKNSNRSCELREKRAKHTK